jgi:glycosyltransferase involved in cell wall biosynthesis
VFPSSLNGIFAKSGLARARTPPEVKKVDNDQQRAQLAMLRQNFNKLAGWAGRIAEQVEGLEVELNRARESAKQAASGAIASAAPTPRHEPSGARGAKRGRAAVVCWDLGHNPAGRAMVLYDLLARDWDVELIGPLWKRFGEEVWKPIAEGQRKVRTFPCETLEQFFPAALTLAENADYSLVVVCKPRLPALFLGAMIKKRIGCPLVLDVDDFELSFFHNETTASLDDLETALPEALLEPYEELATRTCDGLIRDADAVTVSNVALRRRYGGYIVRHARDEIAFRPQRFDRQFERRRMNISDGDFAIMFVGTPRPHKGIYAVAKTLHDLADRHFVFHIVGDITDRRVLLELESYDQARLVLHAGCSFDELPSRLAAADAVVLLQDPGHSISQFQIPAKVSDAAALGLPILTTDVPPLRDLAEQGLVTPIEVDSLGENLQRLWREREAGRHAPAQRDVRAAFEAELGFSINRQRLDSAIARAATAPRELPCSYQRLLDITTYAYSCVRSQRRARLRVTSGHPTVPTANAVDLVMFWKQNDTGLYGRRSDMLMKHLLASGRVRKILQFDAALELAELGRLAETISGVNSAASLTLGNTIDNQYRLRDCERHLLRTYLWDRRQRPAHLVPNVGPSLDAYPSFVASQMEAAGILPEKALAWVCPVVFAFPAIAAAIPFAGIVGDIIDDQRAFQMQASYRRKIEESYEATLPLFDLTLTNCVSLAEIFSPIVGHIHVVPNGTELPDSGLRVPSALTKLNRPIAGYVGNLRDRIDWTLLHDTALELPEVTFVIVGGGERLEDVTRIRRLPNVVFLGVIPYDEVQAYIQGFDVALVPHKLTELTLRMNPLKVYQYFAAGKPIVSTEIANVDAELQPFIRFAAEPKDFANHIRSAVEEPLSHDSGYEAALQGITWQNRVMRITEIIDAWRSSRPQ